MAPKTFVPPRPSASGPSKKTASKSKGLQKSRAVPNPPKSKPARPSTSKTAVVDNTSEADQDAEEEEDEDDEELNDEAENGSDIEMLEAVSKPSGSKASKAARADDEVTRKIPPELLTKLLHEFFKDGKTRIGAEANNAVGKYMETFVREAIARAAFGAVDGGGDFLEVEDLEKLAPQLLLDF